MKNPEIINKLKIYNEELTTLFTKSEYNALKLKSDIKKIQGLISNMHHMVSNDKIHTDNHNVIDSFFKASDSLLQNYHYRQNLAYDHSDEANTTKMSNMKQTLQDLSSFDTFLNAVK